SLLVIDWLGFNIERLRRGFPGTFSLKTILMLAEQMLTTIEGVHAEGFVYRDIKPDIFAMGLLFLFDMGLSGLYLDPDTGSHMPFRDGRASLGTPSFSSSPFEPHMHT
ncbi:kinase-like domain-containing protein, partial [Cristinia sonorae]